MVAEPGPWHRGTEAPASSFWAAIPTSWEGDFVLSVGEVQSARQSPERGSDHLKAYCTSVDMGPFSCVAGVEFRGR